LAELYLEAILLILLIATTLIVLTVKDLMAAIVVYSAFSYFAVLFYLMVGSPDVAFTEAVIGVVSTVFFISALKKLNRGVKH